MRTMKREQKSGFEEGRSRKKKGSSSSSLSKHIDKLEKARNDLAEVLDEEDYAPASKFDKKTKKSRGSHIGLIGSDAEEDDVESVFEKQIAKIKQKIDAADDDFNSAKTEEMLLRALLKTTIDMIPLAEKAFRKTQREQAAYAYRSFVDQTVDFTTRLKMIGDVENQTKFIRENILEPMFRAQTNTFLTAFLSMKGTIDTEVTNRKTAKVIKRNLDESLTSLGEFMDKAIEKITVDIGAYLAGDMSSLNGGPPKKTRRKRKE